MYTTNQIIKNIYINGSETTKLGQGHVQYNYQHQHIVPRAKKNVLQDQTLWAYLIGNLTRVATFSCSKLVVFNLIMGLCSKVTRTNLIFFTFNFSLCFTFAHCLLSHPPSSLDLSYSLMMLDSILQFKLCDFHVSMGSSVRRHYCSCELLSFRACNIDPRGSLFVFQLFALFFLVVLFPFTLLLRSI